MSLDADTLYRALAARDRRFDGRFFVGVATTGIYCRPVCRARTPGRDRCSFYGSAALAEQAGFRACFRCRPELAPGHAPVDAVPRLVAAAVARIDVGALNEASVDDLAGELGVTGRQLRRAMVAELGVGPAELAQSRRLALAKQLLHDAGASIADVALASGFGSIRRFNAAFRERFGVEPRAVRRNHRELAAGGELVLRLEYRPPLAWDRLLAFLAARAIPGVEAVTGDEYQRTVHAGGATGVVVVTHDAARSCLVARVPLALGSATMSVATRLRGLFDLDADPGAIAAHLSRDRLLAGVVARLPGLRVPGAFDPWEVAMRVVLGQQTSVRAATTLAGRLVAAHGGRVPAPAEVADADLSAFPMPAARIRGLQILASAWPDLDVHAPPEEAIAWLEDLPGIGPWTAHMIAMRALRWPDAFPAGDLGVRKALGGLGPRAAAERAERWRPWRSYATSYLWQQLVEERS